MDGQRERARQRYREAATLSGQAGDPEGRERWRRAAQALSG
jgi:hypothetical protein